MIARRLLIVSAVVLMSTTLAAQAPPAASPAEPSTLPAVSALKIGTRVGLPEKSTYDDGGRRDPFVSLIVERAPSVSTGGDSIQARPKGLAGLSVVDAHIKGIITSGDKWIAIVSGPNGTFLAHMNDKLYDGSVRKIERDGVVFVTRVTDVAGKMVNKEVRKAIRATAGDSK
jgi:Tfp pilus assembly protein PilP